MWGEQTINVPKIARLNCKKIPRNLGKISNSLKALYFFLDLENFFSIVIFWDLENSFACI